MRNSDNEKDRAAYRAACEEWATGSGGKDLGEFMFFRALKYERDRRLAYKPINEFIGVTLEGGHPVFISPEMTEEERWAAHEVADCTRCGGSGCEPVSQVDTEQDDQGIAVYSGPDWPLYELDAVITEQKAGQSFDEISLKTLIRVHEALAQAYIVSQGKQDQSEASANTEKLIRGQKLLEWNRAQPEPPISVGKELWVAEQVEKFLTGPEPNQDNYSAEQAKGE